MTRTLIHKVLAATLAVTVPATVVLVPRTAAAWGDKKKQAKAYVDAGLAAQEGGDYDAAVDFYKKAYDLVPHPILLFNIAQAYRLGEKPIEALDYYRRYLDVEPKGGESKVAGGFVKELEPVVAKIVADQKQAADEAAAAAERERIAAEEKRKADEAAAKEKPVGDQPPPGDDDDDGKQPPAGDDDDDDDDDDDAPPPGGGGGGGGMGGKRIAGLTLGGLGLVGIGVGVVFGLKAKSLSDELSEEGATFDPQKVDDGEAAQTNMYVGYGLGAALLVTGAVLYVMGGKRSAESSTAVSFTPVVDPDGTTGLVVSGGF